MGGKQSRDQKKGELPDITPEGDDQSPSHSNGDSSPTTNESNSNNSNQSHTREKPPKSSSKAPITADSANGSNIKKTPSSQIRKKPMFRPQRSFSLPPGKARQNALNILGKYRDKKKNGEDDSKNGSSRKTTPHSETPKMTKFSSAEIEKDKSSGEKSVNNYILGGKIGAGSYGKVKKCKHRITGKMYAVKIIDNEKIRKFCRPTPKPGGARGRFAFLRGRRGRGRGSRFPYRPGRPQPKGEQEQEGVFLLEVAILKKIAHPNIVKLYEIIDVPSKEKTYLIYEWVSGGAVQVIEGNNTCKAPPFSEEKTRKYFRDLLKGVNYLHNLNITHRDIKPENLLLDKETDMLKITDFGISKIHGAKEDILKSSGGTNAFLPPEACSVKSKEYRGKPFDIWCCGVTLYCFLFAKLPFFSNVNILKIYELIREGEVEFPCEIGDDLRDLFNKILHKDPNKRITMKELAVHPWTTENGKSPLEFQNTKKNPTELNDSDLSSAITISDKEKNKGVQNFVMFQKIKLKMREKLNCIRKRKEGGRKGFERDFDHNIVNIYGDLFEKIDETVSLNDVLDDEIILETNH